MRTASSLKGLMSSPVGFLAALILATLLPLVAPVKAADHRDAPLSGESPAGDITDLYAFLDPNDPGRLVLAMGVNPFAVPALPDSYGFSPDLLYQFKIDNNGDAVEDFVVQVKFTGRLGGQTVQIFGPSRPEQLGTRNKLLSELPAVQGATGTILSGTSGVLAFAGLRDDPSVFDFGQYNRILSGSQEVFRDLPDTQLGPLRGRPVRANGTSGVDAFGGFNASYVVVSFPASRVSGATSRLNIWATVSRKDDHPTFYTQFERMGQQLVSAIFIPKALKDAYNASVPSLDVTLFSLFVPDALTNSDNDGTNNTIAGRASFLDTLGVTALPGGAPLLLPPGDFVNTDRDLIRKVVLPDVLRLDLNASPTDVGVLSSGFQNGRRPDDDAVDIAFRLLRQLADINFPAGSGIPGSGPRRARAFDFPQDRRVFAFLQGTDFIEPDAEVPDLSSAGNDRQRLIAFPFIAAPHPLPGEPGTIGFPAQQ